MPDFTGFVGDAYTAPSITQDAQVTVNWYPEVDIRKPEGSRGVIALYPTPGMRLWSANASAVDVRGPVRGMFALPGGNLLLTVIGNQVCLFRLDQPNSIFVSTTRLLTNMGPVSMSSNGVYAMIGDGVARYSYQIATQIVNIMNDGPWPGAVRVDTIDGYMVYNQPGASKQFAATDPLNQTTPALSFASTISSYDNLVTLIVDQRQIALLGEQTMEFWSDVGTTPFPFAIIPGTTRQYGCAAPYSVARFGNGFAFVGQDQLGQGVILYVANYEVKRISTHAIENDLIGKVINDAFAFTYQMAGHVFYQVTFPTANLTWVYDLATEMWHRRSSSNLRGDMLRHRANCSAVIGGLVLVGDSMSSSIYSLDNAYSIEDRPTFANATDYATSGTSIRRVRRCPHLTKEFKRQYFNTMQVQFQPGVGTQTGQGFDPQAMLRWSDDGGSTWSNEHWTGIGKVGQYKDRAIWRRLGWARDRIFEVAITDPVYAPVISANLELMTGVN